MRQWSRTACGAAETRGFARQFAATLKPGTVLALTGDLGAGKTTFVQGLADGLRVHDISQVLSPTYALVNEYPAEGPTLVHLDFYRLEGVPIATALGLEEQIDRGDAVVAVEWAELLPELIPDDAIWIRLTAEAPDSRRIETIGRPGRRAP